MANNEHIQLLAYWRSSLADASRVEIPVEKSPHQYKAVVDFVKGSVSAEQAAVLIDKAEEQLNDIKGRKSKDDPEWEYLDETNILIAPFRVSPDPEYTRYSGEPDVSYPFWIRAAVNREGNLKTHDDTFPYIPRPHLEPQVNEAVNFVFSDVDTVDAAFAMPFMNDGKWNSYRKYLEEVFRKITGVSIWQYSAERHTVEFSYTMVAYEPLTSAADGIIKLYDYLIREKEVPAVLERLADKADAGQRPLLAADNFEQASVRHLGQMAYAYPLSVSQRKSLYHLQTLDNGEILAVNGPPGTGKTTLLQSVVANEVVQSALKGEAPAVILACSTNNQAVTNIIDSFSGITQKPGLLYERWLPGIKGFGLYLPAQGKKVAQSIPHLKRIAGRLAGAHIDKENVSYLATAELQYVDNFERCMAQKGLSVQEITLLLRSKLKEKEKQLEEGIQLWQQYKRISALIEKLAPEADISLFQYNTLNEAQLAQIESAVRALEQQIVDYLDKESVWIKLFGFLRFVKEKRAFRLSYLFRGCPLNYDAVDFYNIGSFHHFFNERLKLIQQIRKYAQAWNQWKKACHIQANPPADDEGFKAAERNRQSFFYDELEMGLKYDLFYLAIHYWEGRWILATQEVIAEDRIHRNGTADAAKRWQRFAMLSPCFVSTFFMAPKFFTYSKLIKGSGSKSVWDTPPLTAFIDLLIVDEAGQVSPEVGAATFALARKAVVVGDTLQIEPVWNVPAKVDHANLFRSRVISDINDQYAIGELLTKGFLSSSGSIMKLAQKATPYQMYQDMERGMMLTEHRRCFDEIITYCNKLAYHGLLEPKKGPAKDILFAPMQFHAVSGISEARGTSKANQEEAVAIASWVLTHQQQIISYYQEIENAAANREKRVAKTLRLADVIGIITPFTGQKYELSKTLRKSGVDLSGLTIGTVHALQGAERPVILFSATYGSNDIKKGYFFDRGVNMLNVAVSRAKDAFVLFGNKEILTKSDTTPSGQLYRYIKWLTEKPMTIGQEASSFPPHP
ncbi:hypothetical protein HF324_22200 [Chitinophaga oryzae]|uniref:AAA domain-containing protein n=1 Tax=Chitinophaga oryzae TaxID=2725414 RepID=A0ABX6LK31_9BACT|nr:AAA domain-containing protein [Chitinophaga oryzae]QJB40408.1 hypothetical protein HF324_22200 [Chitinophaga oryzae]